jgi:hypothetical protein
MKKHQITMIDVRDRLHATVIRGENHFAITTMTINEETFTIAARRCKQVPEEDHRAINLEILRGTD